MGATVLTPCPVTAKAQPFRASGPPRQCLQRIPEVPDRPVPINPREVSAGNPAFIGKLCQPAVAGLSLP